MPIFTLAGNGKHPCPMNSFFHFFFVKIMTKSHNKQIEF